MKTKKMILILSIVLILYLLIALTFEYMAFNHAEYPRMYLYKQAEWYPSLVHYDGGEEYIEGQYSYYGWCYTIEMTVYKNTHTQQVYNFFSERGTAVSYFIFQMRQNCMGEIKTTFKKCASIPLNLRGLKRIHVYF